MFIQDADLFGLRQGDILAGIPFPLLKVVELPLLGTIKDAEHVPVTHLILRA